MILDDQDFSFLIKTKEVDEYVRLFDKRLKGFDNSVFSGNLKLEKNEFNINATVPEFSYDGKRFENIEFIRQRKSRQFKYNNIRKGYCHYRQSSFSKYQTSIQFAKRHFTIFSYQPVPVKTLSDAQLNAKLQTYTDGVKIHFFPSSFILNEKKWTWPGMERSPSGNHT